MDTRPLQTNKRARLERLGVALFLFFIIISLFAGSILANNATLKLKDALQVKALTISSFINPKDIALLKGDVSDLGNPKYQELKSRLIEANSYNGEIRFIYILGKRYDGQLFYYIDSETPNSKNHSLPGEIYIGNNPNEAELFDQGLTYIEGPHKDLLGEWITAYAPIYNTESKAPFAKIGIDMPAEEYHQVWTSIFFATFGIGFFIGLVVLLFTIYLRKVTQLLHRGVSELAYVENQKMNIERSNAQAGLGYFKWNRMTGDLMISDFLAKEFNLNSNTNFSEFKKHITDEASFEFESKIINTCAEGGTGLTYELDFKFDDGSIKRLRFNCNFSQVYENNPKFAEGTILQV